MLVVRAYKLQICSSVGQTLFSAPFSPLIVILISGQAVRVFLRVLRFASPPSDTLKIKL